MFVLGSVVEDRDDVARRVNHAKAKEDHAVLEILILLLRGHGGLLSVQCLPVDHGVGVSNPAGGAPVAAVAQPIRLGVGNMSRLHQGGKTVFKTIGAK